MKNIITLFITVFLLAVSMASCKKTTVTKTMVIKDTIVIHDTIPYDTTIVGFFTGKIGSSNDYPSTQFDILFRANGTVRVYQGGPDTATAGLFPGEGTYTVSGDTVNTTYTFPDSTTFSATGTINPAFTYIGGSWGYGSINNG